LADPFQCVEKIIDLFDATRRFSFLDTMAPIELSMLPVAQVLPCSWWIGPTDVR